MNKTDLEHIANVLETESRWAAPSIAHDVGNVCKWHGFITNGEIITC